MMAHAEPIATCILRMTDSCKVSDLLQSAEFVSTTDFFSVDIMNSSSVRCFITKIKMECVQFEADSVIGLNCLCISVNKLDQFVS